MNLNETTTLSSSINSAPPSPSPSPSTTTRKRRIADVLTPCLIETSVSIVLGTAGYFGYHLGVINAPIDVRSPPRVLNFPCDSTSPIGRHQSLRESILSRRRRRQRFGVDIRHALALRSRRESLRSRFCSLRRRRFRRVHRRRIPC